MLMNGSRPYAQNGGSILYGAYERDGYGTGGGAGGKDVSINRTITFIYHLGGRGADGLLYLTSNGKSNGRMIFYDVQLKFLVD